jgi:tol-pal system protein YbgF
MTIRITTTRAVLAVGLALAYVGLAPATPAAADREHQQIMADLRMLQEQTQQLQALMNDLGEALKAVNTRLDDQTSLERKAFADGKVQMDVITGDIRVVREKVDETNVRLGTITQELESIRLAIPEPGAFAPPPVTSDPATALPGTTPGTVPAPQTTAVAPPPPNPRVQPQQLYQNSYADYAAGNYSLAVQGFNSYLQYFPKSSQAHEAQLMIGEALLADKKHIEAVMAYDRVITNYPGSASVPHAYYKRGSALEQLSEVARARESYETLVKQFPESQPASLASQRLEALNRTGR